MKPALDRDEMRRRAWLPRPTTREEAALLRLTCGHKHRKYGLVTVCDYAVGHLGPHRGGTL